MGDINSLHELYGRPGKYLRMLLNGNKYRSLFPSRFQQTIWVTNEFYRVVYILANQVILVVAFVLNDVM